MLNFSGDNWKSLPQNIFSMNYPASISKDGSGRIYIADTNNSRIIKINDITGSGWTVFGSFGSGRFNKIHGIFVY